MSNFLTFSIETRIDMIRLGEAFSHAFLAPRKGESSGPRHARVVSLLGAVASGKTAFKQAAIAPLAEKESELTEENWLQETRCGELRLGARLLGENLIRIADLGAKTYPFWFMTLFGPRQAIPTDAGLSVRSPQGHGFDLIEHPSLPHLLRSDVIVLFAHVKKRRGAARYFEKMKQAYLAASRMLCAPQKEDQLGKSVDAFDHFETLLERQGATAQKNERLVSLLSLGTLKESEDALLAETQRSGLSPLPSKALPCRSVFHNRP